MRCVEIEVLSRDLWVGVMKGIGGGIGGQCEIVGREGKGGGGQTEWESLCVLWARVRGLRLVVKGPLTRPSKSASGKEKEEGFEKEEAVGKESLLGIRQNWILNGLLKLRSLRYLELGIEDDTLSREKKIGFCAELEGSLNSLSRREERVDDWEGNVRVIFVEKVVTVAKVVEELDSFYAGEPGDEEAWGWNL
jgi:hypothetical protein